MKQVGLFLLLFIAFLGCKEPIVDKPEKLIDKDIMIDIYYDISILNASKATAANKLEEYNFDPEEYIYRKYNVDSAQLSQNSIYYTSNPNVQLEMFTEVEKRLQKLKDSIDSKLKKTQKIQVKKSEEKAIETPIKTTEK